MEPWVLILLMLIALMAFAVPLLHAISRSGTRVAGTRACGNSSSPASPVNYRLAPRHPDVMAAALFELLSTRLGFDEITAFSDLVISAELTGRYLNRVSARPKLAQFAENLAFLCRSMEVNGFSDSDRARVSEALHSKASMEYKLLQIHKNMDKIF
ncbi:MAG: hypothetical protein U9P14_07175 [Gemmatimonadota bacterium]|nr:hypothetical protein [Gemmatimonadota bacterium]